MQIGLVNQSTLVTEADFHAMTMAIYQQANDNLVLDWERKPVSIQIYENVAAVPAAVWPVVLTDSIQDQPAGVLGYHTEDEGGKLSGIVAAKPELDAGYKVLTGDWSVSSVLSHEVCELIIDPNCQLWANNGRTTNFSFEVCDPVEGPTYLIDNVSVANYVLPDWFDPLAPKNGPFDHLRHLDQPFEILKTGYVVYETAKGVKQRNGDEFPLWRAQMKKENKHSRTSARLRSNIDPVKI